MQVATYKGYNHLHNKLVRRQHILGNPLADYLRTDPPTQSDLRLFERVDCRGIASGVLLASDGLGLWQDLPERGRPPKSPLATAAKCRIKVGGNYKTPSSVLRPRALRR